MRAKPKRNLKKEIKDSDLAKVFHNCLNIIKEKNDELWDTIEEKLSNPINHWDNIMDKVENFENYSGEFNSDFLKYLKAEIKFIKILVVITMIFSLCIGICILFK